MQTMIQVQGLTKRFGHRKRAAVADFDLQVEEGQLFGLIGPDGAGKTTALRLLSTVLETSAGEGTVGGFDLKKDVEQVRRNIGYMPQQFSLYPDLSVMENLVFFADMNQVPSQKKQDRIVRSFRRLACPERFVVIDTVSVDKNDRSGRARAKINSQR